MGKETGVQLILCILALLCCTISTASAAQENVVTKWAKLHDDTLFAPLASGSVVGPNRVSPKRWVATPNTILPIFFFIYKNKSDKQFPILKTFLLAHHVTQLFLWRLLLWVSPERFSCFLQPCMTPGLPLTRWWVLRSLLFCVACVCFAFWAQKAYNCIFFFFLKAIPSTNRDGLWKTPRLQGTTADIEKAVSYAAFKIMNYLYSVSVPSWETSSPSSPNGGGLLLMRTTFQFNWLCTQKQTTTSYVIYHMRPRKHIYRRAILHWPP